MGIYNGLNKNINMPFLGLGVVVAVGLIWATGNFSNLKGTISSEDRNIASVEFDVAALETDQQGLVVADSEILSLSQDDAMFVEIDQASDNISGISDLALDEKSLKEEAIEADISGDLDALDNGAAQSESDQAISDILQ